MHPLAQATPAPARWLGIAGLAPFFVIVAWGLATPGDRLSLYFPLVAYGAVILTFVGALHWDVAMMLPDSSGMDNAGRWRLMGWSVVPAAIAWASLLLPPGIDLILLFGTFWVHFAFDYAMARRYSLPAWYMQLRLVLTVGATLTLLIALTDIATPADHAAWHPHGAQFEMQGNGGGCPVARSPAIEI